MKLVFNTNVLAAAELSLRKPLISILAELESEEGCSLSTLRALVAAGRYGVEYPRRHSFFPVFIDETTAGRLIDEHGTGTAAEAVGKALKAYLERDAA